MAIDPPPFEVLVRWIESSPEYQVPVPHASPTSPEELLENKAHVCLSNIVLGNTALNEVQHQYLADAYLLFNSQQVFNLWVKRWQQAHDLIRWKSKQMDGSGALSTCLCRLKSGWQVYDPEKIDRQYKALHAFLYPHRRSLGLDEM